MKKLLASLFTVFTLMGCTLPPLPFENDATSQNVNKQLICAEKIELFPLSINGANPPQEAFDYYVEKIKKYTTHNLVIHETLNMTLEHDEINDFIQTYGDGNLELWGSSGKYGEAFVNFKEKAKASKSAIVMIYTPVLFNRYNDQSNLRGYAFNFSSHPHIVAYNETTINDAPVISDTQAWKIVLTHEVGHRFGVPAKKTHNKLGHCTSRECIMYAQPDWQAVVSVLFHGMPYDFCDKCKAELEESKHKCLHNKEVPPLPN